MELLPILGNLFGANFLPDLEIRSSQNITVTVFESKKKKPFFFSLAYNLSWSYNVFKNIFYM